MSYFPDHLTQFSCWKFCVNFKCNNGRNITLQQTVQYKNRNKGYNNNNPLDQIIIMIIIILIFSMECPKECREAVPSLIYAAARFADLPELRNLRNLFTEKYGNSLDCWTSKELAICFLISEIQTFTLRTRTNINCRFFFFFFFKVFDHLMP